MSVEIFYFSGTGNSLFAADELRKRLPDAKLLPIAGMLNKEGVRSQADAVGFVFPLQGPTFPNAVRLFLQKVDLTSADYLFAIATRGGTTCRIRTEMDKILKRKGKRLNAHFVLTVFSNDPKLKSDDGNHGFHALTAEELARKTEEIKAKLDCIKDIVARKETSHNKDTDYIAKMGFFLERLLLLAIKTQEKKSMKDYFYADSKCVGCGVCEKVCLSGRIQMKGGKPVWRDEKLCYLCYACLNYCPGEAVQIRDKWFMKSHTATQGRYSHPYASAADIEKQKRCQGV